MTQNSIRKGILWSGIEKMSFRGIQFILSLIIARLVSPSDYGIVAMLTVFISIAQVFVDSGFGNALIQKSDRNEKDFSTVFYFNLFVGFFLYLILYVSSSQIADFYNEPKLEMAAKVIGLNLILNASSIIQRTKLTLLLDFKKQTLISIVAVVISGITGIILAYKGFGYWALIAQTLINSSLNSILLWLLGSWKPLLDFSIKSFKELFSFGSKLLFSALLDVVYTNLYTLIIGKKFTSTELGYYNRAYTFVSFPTTTVTNITSRVMFPAWCQMKDDNNIIQSFLKTLRILAYIIFPLILTISIMSEQLITIVLTEKWLEMKTYLIIISIGFVVYPLTAINDNILKVKGRSDYFLKAEALKKIVGFIILIISLPFGIKIICVGLSVYFIVGYFINMYFTRKAIGLKQVEQLKEFFPIVIMNIIFGIILIGLSKINLNIYMGSFVSLTGGAFSYLLLTYLFRNVVDIKFLLK